MHYIDYLIFIVYFAGILSVGFYFFRKNTDREDYFVGGRSMTAGHIGMSIVATDVGGGFSIGLGGLGFIMGIAGSWLLFTGLVGAWLAAIFLVPRIKKIDKKQRFISFPDFLDFHFGPKVALVAAIISGIGYLGFTGAQILAGAKLAAGTVFADISYVDPLNLALYVMAFVVIGYTVLGGIKAVIYTDTIQWIVLLIGLILFGIPIAIHEVGGIQAIFEALPPSHFDLFNITWIQILNWSFTIIPIWFIAMTLYQRIYACRSEKEARRAFFIAGILEYPIMAFAGVILGMIARINFPGAEAEMGMPMLLRDVLPFGITGIVLAAYFSAIMSTADSCLIASSGNFVNDIMEKYIFRGSGTKFVIRLSQVTTLIVGLLAIIIAGSFHTVLEIILQAYSFMVAGLFVPTLIALFKKEKSTAAVMAAMTGGGGITLFLIFTEVNMPGGLDPSVAGIALSASVYFLLEPFTSKETRNV